MRSPHFRAILQALFVTFLWSTSWVFIKIGLDDINIPALTFAGLRYTLAFVVLLLYGLRGGQLQSVRSLSRRDWLLLATLGIIFYSITQGSQFVALDYLPAVSLSLLLNFSAVVVALMGIFLLNEYPTRIQWVGILIFLVGVFIYFYPIIFPQDIVFGLAIGFISVLANSGGSVLGRFVNRTARIPAFTITLISMGIGAVLLLITGIITQGLPQIPLDGWAIILWLAIINTAFAFTLWNHTLRTLSAVESSVINNTMLIQIAVLAWLFLGETITLLEGIGLAIAAIGILIVQLRRRKAKT